MYSEQTFTKAERLCSKRLIDKLFTQGKSFFIYPCKVIYCRVGPHDKFSAAYPVKVLISVSKRNFKRAVDRNKIKRLLRESYRRNKALLYEALGEQEQNLTIGIIFTGKSIPTYDELEKKIIQALHRLILKLKENKK
jgi:ribonuclease P protein component